MQGAIRLPVIRLYPHAHIYTFEIFGCWIFVAVCGSFPPPLSPLAVANLDILIMVLDLFRPRFQQLGMKPVEGGRC